MTDEELAQMTAELLAATPLEDPGHAQSCDCLECQAAWTRGGVYQAYATRAVKREMPRLIQAHLELRDAARELCEALDQHRGFVHDMHFYDASIERARAAIAKLLGDSG